MTASRESQDFGNRLPFDRLSGGRLLLAPHDGLPDTQPGRNARYGRELYLTAWLQQAEVAVCRNDISPSSSRQESLLCSARSIQPARVDVPIPALLNAAVASTPALPGPASLRSPERSPHPVSRSPGLAGHRLSLQGAPGIRSRLDLPPFSFSPFRLVAAEPRSGNVLLRVRGLRSGCGRTAVLGHASRLSARLHAMAAARPSADRNPVSLCLVGGVSCMGLYRPRPAVQFRQRQHLADSGKILPSPCGSRFCAARSGARTLRKNCNSSPAAATGRVAPGHRATALRRSTSCSCSCAINRSAAACSTAACATATQRGCSSCSAPNGSRRKSTRSISHSNAGGAASAGLIAAGRISNGSPGAPLARCDLFDRGRA